MVSTTFLFCTHLYVSVVCAPQTSSFCGIFTSITRSLLDQEVLPVFIWIHVASKDQKLVVTCNTNCAIFQEEKKKTLVIKLFPLNEVVGLAIAGSPEEIGKVRLAGQDTEPDRRAERPVRRLLLRHLWLPQQAPVEGVAPRDDPHWRAAPLLRRVSFDLWPQGAPPRPHDECSSTARRCLGQS
jgi:hypothetical protein